MRVYVFMLIAFFYSRTSILDHTVLWRKVEFIPISFKIPTEEVFLNAVAHWQGICGKKIKDFLENLSAIRVLFVTVGPSIYKKKINEIEIYELPFKCFLIREPYINVEITPFGASAVCAKDCILRWIDTVLFSNIHQKIL